MTADYGILAPNESMVLTAMHQSTVGRFVVDPVATLQNLDHAKLEERANYLMRELKKNPRQQNRCNPRKNELQSACIIEQGSSYLIIPIWSVKL
jgi:hypothetical protein